MMPGAKTNEIPGTRAQVRHVRMSAYKAREVLDLIRGLPVGEAQEVLQFTERSASVVIARALTSAVANAQHNDELDPDTLYVSTCYADEGPTLKRWRPRARGRATRIRKRMCHITIIVSPMPPEMAARVEAREVAGGTTPAGRRGRRAQESRRARVARSRGEAVTAAEPEDEEPTTGEPTDEMVEDAEAELADAEPTDGEALDVEDEAPEAEDTTETEDETSAEPETPADSDDESPDQDESTDDRGVDSAAGGVAEGDASTEA
jgi:large subunit ribosomal protein L22